MQTQTQEEIDLRVLGRQNEIIINLLRGISESLKPMSSKELIQRMSQDELNTAARLRVQSATLSEIVEAEADARGVRLDDVIGSAKSFDSTLGGKKKNDSHV